MALPVMELFSEKGYNVFNTPDDAFDQFLTGGIFKRSQVKVSTNLPNDAVLATNLKKEALYNLALNYGLSCVICQFIGAKDDSTGQYVLTEPVGVRNWAATLVHDIEKSCSEVLRCVLGGATLNRGIIDEKLYSELKKLTGLRNIFLALIDRFMAGSEDMSKIVQKLQPNRFQEQGIPNELDSITNSNMSYLISLLYLSESLYYQCRFGLFLSDREIEWDTLKLMKWYETKRMYKMQHVKSLKSLIRNSSLTSKPMMDYGGNDNYMPHTLPLLIETVIASNGVDMKHVFQNDLPLRHHSDLFTWLQNKTLFETILEHFQTQSDNGINCFFQKYFAILSYCALDLSYLTHIETNTKDSKKALSGEYILKYLRQNVVEPFAITMKASNDVIDFVFSIWLIENMPQISKDVKVTTVLYTFAIKTLQVHVNRCSDIINYDNSNNNIDGSIGFNTSSLLINILNVLIERSEYNFAWQIYTTCIMSDTSMANDIFQSLENILVMLIELNQWEYGLQLIRDAEQFQYYYLILEYHERKQSLDQYIRHYTIETNSTTSTESIEFETFMLQGVLQSNQLFNTLYLRRIDFLIMYYGLRYQFQEAISLHEFHLKCLHAQAAQGGGGNSTNGLSTLLNHPSFQFRQKLITNLSINCGRTIGANADFWKVKCEQLLRHQAIRVQTNTSDSNCTAFKSKQQQVIDSNNNSVNTSLKNAVDSDVIMQNDEVVDTTSAGSNSHYTNSNTVKPTSPLLDFEDVEMESEVEGTFSDEQAANANSHDDMEMTSSEHNEDDAKFSDLHDIDIRSSPVIDLEGDPASGVASTNTIGDSNVNSNESDQDVIMETEVYDVEDESNSTNSDSSNNSSGNSSSSYGSDHSDHDITNGEQYVPGIFSGRQPSAQSPVSNSDSDTVAQVDTNNTTEASKTRVPFRDYATPASPARQRVESIDISSPSRMVAANKLNDMDDNSSDEMEDDMQDAEVYKPGILDHTTILGSKARKELALDFNTSNTEDEMTQETNATSSLPEDELSLVVPEPIVQLPVIQENDRLSPQSPQPSESGDPETPAKFSFVPAISSPRNIRTSVSASKVSELNGKKNLNEEPLHEHFGVSPVKPFETPPRGNVNTLKNSQSVPIRRNPMRSTRKKSLEDS